MRKAGNRSRGLSQFSSDENGTVPFGWEGSHARGHARNRQNGPDHAAASASSQASINVA